jgi:pimeloyl-ACP methyl ester carboxylesterase
VRGARSELLTAEGAAALASELPCGRLVEIPDAGHNAHLERPAEVLLAIRSFLAGIG